MQNLWSRNLVRFAGKLVIILLLTTKVYSMSFFNSAGLINARTDETFSENSLLFSLEYLLLDKSASSRNKVRILMKYQQLLKKLRKSPGRFDQQPFLDGTHDDLTSHDQLTAISIFSKKYGLQYHEEIWSYLKSHWFTYNNLTGKTDFSRLLHPRDMIYYGMLNNSAICWALSPLYFIMQAPSLFGKSTSGKLLMWTRLKGLGLHKLVDFLPKLMLQYSSWKEVFRVYYPDSEHPIRRILEEK